MTKAWTYFVIRPLAFYVAPFFKNIGISTNGVILLSLLPLIAGMLFIVLGSKAYSNFIFGAMLLNIWYLTNVIDWSIAGCNNKSSRFGAFFYWFIRNLCQALLPVCLGIAIYLTSPTKHSLEFGLNFLTCAWFIAAIILITNIHHNIVSLKGERIV